MDEFENIARHFAPLAGEGAFGLADDAALLPLRAGQDVVVTTDTIAEGVDFLAADPPDTIAQKALRVNLSDLAAKGAVPAYYLLNLTLPQAVHADWLPAFAAGLARDQRSFGLSLLGGDTGAGPLSIAVTAFGFVPQGRMIRRGGARPGDAVYVTGTIGDSGGGLAILQGQKNSLGDAGRDYLILRYRVPQPPVAFAAALRAVAHASVDISDGLIADLGHVAAVSGVRIIVEGERVPLSAPLRALWGADALLRAVTAGDDYQIAFTAPPGLSGPFTQIGLGRTAGAGVGLTAGGKPVAVPKPGYTGIFNHSLTLFCQLAGMRKALILTLAAAADGRVVPCRLRRGRKQGGRAQGRRGQEGQARHQCRHALPDGAADRCRRQARRLCLSVHPPDRQVRHLCPCGARQAGLHPGCHGARRQRRQHRHRGRSGEGGQRRRSKNACWPMRQGDGRGQGQADRHLQCPVAPLRPVQTPARDVPPEQTIPAGPTRPKPR